METLRRIVYLMFRPSAEWNVIAKEATSVDVLLRSYIIPLGLLAPIAAAIGMNTFDREWDSIHGYAVPSGQIFAASATTFFIIVGSIFVLAAIFVLIAPMFGGARDYLAALKVATYGSIPMLLAGATLLLPIMALIGLVGLCHTLYLLAMGARHVLNVPPGEVAEFIGISVLLLSFVSVLGGAAAGTLGLI